MTKTWTAGAVALLLALLMVSTSPARAQNERDASQLRTVHGTVMDHNDNPVVHGIVYLRNKKSNMVRTYITDSKGHYRFTGLDSNVDFEIHAEYKNMKSGNHTISSFDDRRDIQLDLFLTKKK